MIFLPPNEAFEIPVCFQTNRINWWLSAPTYLQHLRCVSFEDIDEPLPMFIHLRGLRLHQF